MQTKDFPPGLFIDHTISLMSSPYFLHHPLGTREGGRWTEKETRSSTFSLLALRVFKRKGNFIKEETIYELAKN